MQHKAHPLNHKITAWGLIIFSLLAMLIMLQHPTVSAHHPAEQVTEILLESGVNAWVHGILIAIIVVFGAAMLVYSKWRGMQNIAVATGLISYLFGIAAMTGAALVSGFIFPEMAAEFSSATPEELVNFAQFNDFSWHTNQVLAEFGTLCWLIALLAWGLDLLRENGIRRLFAWLSCGIATTMILALLMGWYSLDLTGATLVLLIVCCWNLMVAYLFLRSH